MQFAAHKDMKKERIGNVFLQKTAEEDAGGSLGIVFLQKSCLFGR